VLVDPYDLFDLIKVEGFNQVKPYIDNSEQMHKPVTLYRTNPDVVILGSSIAQVSIDPYEVERVTGLKTYNFGIDGPTMYEMYSFFNFAVRNTNAKKMIVLIDFMMFNGGRGLHNSRFNYKRMQLDLSNEILDYFNPKEIVNVFFSINTFTKSLKTIFNQSGQSTYDLGFNREQYALYERPINYSLVFYETRKAYLSFFYAHNSKKDWFTTSEGFNLFESFRKMVNDARKNEIELSIVLTPVNVHFMEGLQDSKHLGLTFLDWKQTVIDIIDKENKKTTKKSLAFFDYTNTKDKRNRETIPEPYTSPMIYWNDAYHSSIYYGNEIIRDVFGNN